MLRDDLMIVVKCAVGEKVYLRVTANWCVIAVTVNGAPYVRVHVRVSSRESTVTAVCVYG